MKRETDNIIDYISRNRDNFEVGKFEGDIFWLNDLVFSGIAVPLDIVFMTAYKKSDPKGFWTILDFSVFNKPASKFYKKYGNNPSLLRTAFYRHREKCWKYFQKLIRSDNVDKKLYFDFVKVARVFGVSSVYSLEALEMFLAKIIESKITNSRKKENLTFPLYTSYVQEQNEELIKILQQIPRKEFLMLKKGRTDLSKYKKFSNLIKKHREEWGWTLTNYGSHRLPPISLVVKRAIELANNINKELKLLKEIEKKKKTKQRLLKRQSSEIKKLIIFFDVVVELRDRRKAFWLKITIPGKNWLKNIAGNFKLSYDDLRWLTWEEQCRLDSKNKGKLLKIINKRKADFVVLYGYKKQSQLILTGKHAKKVAKILFERKKSEVLEGISTSLGKVSGRVRNIRHTKEFKKFKKGEILVASHTTPDYVPIMKKAKAILTERGGITSHAAIVSRELGVPCIVGIKGLAGNFKNGDLVEVDAKRGVS